MATENESRMRLVVVQPAERAGLILPLADGQFVIGGGKTGLYLVAALPMLTWCATFGLALTQGGVKTDFIVAVALAATAYPAYALCRRLWGGPPREESVFDPPARRAEAP